MNSKERVKINVYKQLLNDEKKKNKLMSASILSVLILTVFTFTTYKEYENSKANYNLLSYVNEDETEEENISGFVLEKETESEKGVRGDLYDEFFTNI